MSRNERRPGEACFGIAAAILVCLAVATPGAAEETRYDTAHPIRQSRLAILLRTSGPLSSNGIIARTEGAYFKMINEQGALMDARSSSFLTMMR